MAPSAQDISQFTAITQASEDEAIHWLESSGSLEAAVQDYLAAQDSADTAGAVDDFSDNETPSLATTGGASGAHTLSGAPVQDTLPAGWGKPQRSLFGRIQHNDDDRGDDDKDPEELFAGGGRNSGLAVQNPDNAPESGNSLVDKILKAARRNGAAPPRSNEPAKPSSGSAYFGGAGNTLGSDETPSTSVPSEQPSQSSGPSVQTGGMPGGFGGLGAVPPGLMEHLMNQMSGRSGTPPSALSPGPSNIDHIDPSRISTDENGETVVHRSLTFWRNGFSIEDGPLLPYEEPQNRHLLHALEEGRAPSAAFGVPFDQRVNVEVHQRRGDDYVAPKKKMRAFEGGGQRLGDAVPEVASSSASPMPGSLPVSSSNIGENTGKGTSGETKFEVDPSKPTTNIQLRFGDGSRQVARVNLSHTIADLRSYVTAARADSRPFVLQTTFPSRELSDMNETVEGAKLQNAVVVQRFV
ncbi:UBX domain-containing protein 1 [Cryptococcus deuterogattii MMRL2647]|nr:UBX domain-containing protein 1 [Cryptococcus deuterogattii MMRL2647]